METAATDDRPRVLSERQGKWMLNLFPPLLFNRIRVVRFGPGFSSCEVRIARSLLTRNLNGTTFGGTIFTAADPFYALMYWQILARRGRRVRVWLRRASISYRRPAATALTMRFELSPEDVSRAELALDRDGRFSRSHSIEAIDRSGAVCAVVETEVYLGSPKGDRDGSAF